MLTAKLFQLYLEEPSGNLADGSEICACQGGGELVCAFLEQVENMPCNTDNIYYRYSLPVLTHLHARIILVMLPPSTLPIGVAAFATLGTSSVPRRTILRLSRRMKFQ